MKYLSLLGIVIGLAAVYAVCAVFAIASIVWWLFLFILWFVFNLTAYLVAPLLPLAARPIEGPCDNNNAIRTEPRLPSWLSWFMTDDNSLNGDGTFEKINPPSYWSQVKWLWRNPAVGFERTVLSARISPDSVIHVAGNPKVQDGPAGLEGYCFTTISGYWNIYWVKRIGETWCIKLDLGWQLKTYAEDQRRMQTQPRARYAMSPLIRRFLVL